MTIVDQFGITISGFTPSLEVLGHLLKKKKKEEEEEEEEKKKEEEYDDENSDFA